MMNITSGRPAARYGEVTIVLLETARALKKEQGTR
jgi:hypothetical protein